MPTTIHLEHPPEAITLTAALKDEMLTVCTQARLSSEDGAAFLFHLEAIWRCFDVPMRKRGVFPSQVDHFLAIMTREGEATLYCNELQQRILVRSKRRVDAGQQVSKDDIADMEELTFHDASGTRIEIPPECGVVVILSHGWRKSLFYDLGVDSESVPRTVDMGKLLGRMMAELWFQEVYSIADDQWMRMIDWGWFPFIWMTDTDRTKVIGFSTREQEPRTILEEVCESYRSVLPERLDSWRKKGSLQEQMPFLEKSLEHYLAGDYLSCIQVLFPRIEGVMRKLHLLRCPEERASQSTMVNNLVASKSDYSLLLPARFKDYLLGFYFRSFDVQAGDIPLSRHSVAHGASLPEDYDFLKASLGFMILDQIFYYVGDFDRQPE